MSNVSLFERLGGTAGIEKLVDDIVALHLKNPVINARFLPYLEMPERVAEVKKHTVAFFTAGSGGPAAYKGRSMRDAHKGMNVSESEYMAAVDDILAALDSNGRDEQTKKDVLAIAYSLKGEILHV